MRGPYSAVHRVRILAYNGIEHGANSGIVSDCEIRCVGDGIKIYNGDNTSTIENCIIASYDFTGTPDGGNGIVVESGACANLKNVSTLLKNNGVKFTGTFTSFNAIQCWFDNCNDGVRFEPGSSTTRTRINNCWFNGRNHAVHSYGNVEALWLDNCEFYKSGSRTVRTESETTINNFNITNCFVCPGESKEGIDLYLGAVTNIIINNNNFTPYDGAAAFYIAISINSNTSGIISGNCMRGAQIPVNGTSETLTIANNAV